MKRRIILVGASPRKGGNSDKIIEYVKKGIEDSGGIAVTVQLRNLDISPCIGCEKCRKDKTCTGIKDGMNPLYKKISGADGIFLVSPVHNYNITAWMKAFIDRLYCFYEFEEPRPGKWSSRLADQGKKAVICAVCEQNDEADINFTIDAMTKPMSALGYDVIEKLPFLGVFSKGEILERQEYLNRAVIAGESLANTL